MPTEPAGLGIIGRSADAALSAGVGDGAEVIRWAPACWLVQPEVLPIHQAAQQVMMDSVRQTCPANERGHR